MKKKKVKLYDTMERCAACGGLDRPNNWEHHIISRGARPDLADKEWNKIPTCIVCHIPKWHAYGTRKMVLDFPGVKKWLEEHGWYYSKTLNKWWHDGASVNQGGPP